MAACSTAVNAMLLVTGAGAAAADDDDAAGIAGFGGTPARSSTGSAVSRSLPRLTGGFHGHSISSSAMLALQRH